MGAINNVAGVGDNSALRVPKRVLNTLLNALSAGVVPRIGAPYIAIGRTQEIKSLLYSLSMAEEGGAGVRFVIGRYGSGKSFLLQLIRGNALERDFLCVDADLSPERRFCGGNGAGVATYRELMRNLASKACPEGGALTMVLSRYYSNVQNALIQKGILPTHTAFSVELYKSVYGTLAQLQSSVGGFDFAHVLSEYYSACAEEDESKKEACLRWLCGEYATRTEARREMGFSVSAIINDDNWYEYIKLWAQFARLVGYKGLLVIVDECVNLYKIPNRIARESNYEKLLSIFNDAMQGRATGVCFFFGGTPQFLEDTRRGLFSYEAMKSRLTDGKLGELGYQNTSSPVIRLRRLSDNELLALLERLSFLCCQRDGGNEVINGEQRMRFLTTVLARVGTSEMITPREIIRDYLLLIEILREDSTADFDTLLSRAYGGTQQERADNSVLTALQAGSPVADGNEHVKAEAPERNTAQVFRLQDLEL